MENKELVKELLLYAKSIVAFSVVQGLTYCYSFGKSEFFNTLLINNSSVSYGLTVFLTIALVFSIIANRYLSKQILLKVNNDEISLFKRLLHGQLLVIIFFQIIPIIITIAYAILDVEKG